MRVLLILTAAIAFSVLATAVGQAEKPQEVKASSSTRGTIEAYWKAARQQEKLEARFKKTCPSLRKAIVFYRARTWGYQEKLGFSLDPTYYPERKKHACAYKHHVMVSWRGKAAANRGEFERLSDPQEAICEVFGHHCQQALSVSWCESRHSVNARNGQYLGIFQMGSSERELFGHGDTAYEQAKAAYRYFILSGSDWSPWSCRP